jgi:voltage-gated potassium channel
VPQGCKIPFRKRLSQLFDDDAPRNAASRLFNLLLALLIIVNVITVIFETVEPIRQKFETIFVTAEHVATTIFAVEYVLRVWTAVDLRSGRFSHPVWGRLRYMRSFFAVIDLVAVLPAVLGVLGADDIRVLRLLRLLRMLKLTRHSSVFSLLWAVFREEAQSIGALLFILCLTLTISGALAYMVEGNEQPAVFSSIPAAMWWAIETLTTVGYGDMVPATVVGKILGGFVSIVGIGTLALFSGVITVGFLDQLRIRREQAPGMIRAPIAAAALNGVGDRLDPAGPTGPAHQATIPNLMNQICPHCGLSRVAQVECSEIRDGIAR